MGQILHKRATTTHRTRAEIQQSKETIAELAARLGVNPKTVLKWKHRDGVEDAAMGAKTLRTVLTPLEEDMICAVRRKAQLPLDDCYIVLKPFIPKLTRSNLHRCLQRHGLSVLPKNGPAKPAKKKFKDYPPGFIHIDICEARTGEAKAYLYVAVDRTTKFAYAEVHSSPTMKAAAGFLENTAKALPYKIHKVLTDNGAQFTYALLLPHCRPKGKVHPFDAACEALTIEHRLTRIKQPWTNGQVERMNRTLKEATVKAYHYDTVAQFKAHLHDFLMAYNFSRKLKSLRFLTPYEKIIAEWKKQPHIFHSNPNHYLVGLNT